MFALLQPTGLWHFAESPGLGARNDHRLFTKVGKGSPAPAPVPFSQLMTRGRAEVKCCKHFPNVYFQGLLTWPVHDPILSHRLVASGGHEAPTSALGNCEQSEKLMDLSSRMFSSRVSYPHQERERVIGFKCQDVPSVRWKAHISFLSYRFFWCGFF